VTYPTRDNIILLSGYQSASYFSRAAGAMEKFSASAMMHFSVFSAPFLLQALLQHQNSEENLLQTFGMRQIFVLYGMSISRSWAVAIHIMHWRSRNILWICIPCRYRLTTF
jgi:hypothetical protein